VGAGTGRLVAEVRRHLPEVQVVAIERSSRNLAELTRRFRGDRKVTLLGRDLLEAPEIKPCHIALWFFSGIVEFHPEERPRALARIREMVTPNGLLFLELTGKISPRVSTTENADGSVEVHYADARIRIQVPDLEAVEEDAREAGWDPVGVLDYESGTGLPRSILVLQRRK
jgi:SAM-dependent methyltransferase